VTQIEARPAFGGLDDMTELQDIGMTALRRRTHTLLIPHEQDFPNERVGGIPQGADFDFLGWFLLSCHLILYSFIENKRPMKSPFPIAPAITYAIVN
jgi:hypothetical protein